MNSFIGRVLVVDLTAGSTTVETPPDSIYRAFPGGTSLALHFLLDRLPREADALSPANVLVFATGALTGCPVPGMSRYTVASKSPLTGGYGEAEAGGWFGPELKFAGFDAVVFTGKARSPVYLWVHDGEAELRDASGLWGLGIRDTQRAITSELGDARVRVAAIGPAGENLVRFASVASDIIHVNGRCGLGAVMGSKNLKAVAARGTGRGRPNLSFADGETLKQMARLFVERWKKDQVSQDRFRLGTPRQVLLLNAMGLLPTRNFREGQFGAAEAISGERMVADGMMVGSEGCYACPCRCKKVLRIEGESGVDPAFGAPEYETLGALGSSCGVSDLAAVARANQLCNDLGLDSICTGSCISMAMECYEAGILSREDAGGLDLRFGNAEAMLALVEGIGRRRNGLGRTLGEGVLAAARAIGGGAEAVAVHVKGQGLAMHDPRGKVGLGLAYAVSPTGPDHMEVCHDPMFSWRSSFLDEMASLGVLEPVGATDLSARKVRAVLYLQLLRQIDNNLGVCAFVSPGLGVFTSDDIVRIARAATGWNVSLWELMKASERALTMARVFNVREGIGRAADTLPPRLFEPLPTGPSAGLSMREDELARAVSTYYAMMGWDPETGVPGEAKLDELGIGHLRAWITSR